MRNHKIKNWFRVDPEEQHDTMLKLRYLKPKTTGTIDVFRFIKFRIKTKPIADISKNEYSLEEIILMKDYYREHKQIELLQLYIRTRFMKRIPKWLIAHIRIVPMIQVFNNFSKEIEVLTKAEIESWESKNGDSDWSIADPENKMSRFGHYAMTRTIAKDFKTKPVDVYKWDYKDIFVEMSYRATESTVTRNYQRIKESKLKNKKA